ncbi:hypothetical protein CDAR_390481 [Caerostris darwini]|uniref:Uncharacterized protein n=1 Tax=Caerostris darwini TaxID=1538125 RepID=A0AAV4NZ62_9ARAC|nr:hypothetical protein CDAR_390481 [Caerostris darwini]
MAKDGGSSPRIGIFGSKGVTSPVALATPGWKRHRMPGVVADVRKCACACEPLGLPRERQRPENQKMAKMAALRTHRSSAPPSHTCAP